MRYPLHETQKMYLDHLRRKKNKNVIILSSLHPDVAISTDGNKLSETVAFYNTTKCRIHTLDQMARKYGVKAASRRWPIELFSNVLDLAAINARIIHYNCVTGKRIGRFTFILKIAQKLRRNYLAMRINPELKINYTAEIKKKKSTASQVPSWKIM